MERLRSCAEKLSSTDISVQENSLRYLINGSTESAVQTIIFGLVGSKKLKELLQSENEVIQMLSTWLLSHLCLNNENCVAVLQSDFNLISSLIELLVNDNQDVIEKSLWVLTNLTLCAEHSHVLVEYDVVDSLINNFIKKSNHALIILACQPLRNLMHKDTCAEYLDNQKTFCHSGAITNITKLLSSRYPTPSNDLILSLSSIIHVLSIYHPLIRRIISISGVLNQLIAFLSSPSSPLNVKEQVVKILINLSLTEETEKPILDSGAIMPLIDSVASVSSPLSLKALSISCLANLTANSDIRRVLRSKYLVDGLNELLRDLSQHTSELLEAISVLIANLCIDENCRYILNDSGCESLLMYLVDYPHSNVRGSIMVALENLRVPVSDELLSEMNNMSRIEDLSDLDPTDSLGPSLSLSPSPLKNGLLRYSTIRSISPIKEMIDGSSATGSSCSGSGSGRCASPSPSQSSVNTTPPLSNEEHSTISFRRGKIIKEIVDTEQAYIYSLNVCIRVYYNPLVVAPTNPPILPEELVNQIFSNIDQIFRVNCEFLKKLRSIQSAIDEADIIEISQAFQWLWDQQYTIPEYRVYINGFNRALDLIHENRSKLPKFKEFLDKCQFSDQCKSETLESYLIRPVQRIPRYILLLTDLLSHTTDALERNSLEEALRRTKTVADQLNESKRTAENLAKARHLKDKVIGIQETGFQIIEGESQLLKEGLMMEARQKKVSKYRYLLLFNDALYITKQKKSKYLIKRHMPLLDVKVIDVPSNENVENSFRLYWSRRDDRNENAIVISSSTPEAKEDWIREIREASNCQKKAHLHKVLNSKSHSTANQ